MVAKKISQQDITGQRGINLIEKVVLDMGCVWNPTNIDAGIDGYIEIRNPVTQEMTNSVIQVQSKATAEPLLRNGRNSFEYVCDERDLMYWLNGNAPVIFIRSSTTTGEVFWVSIKDYFKDLNVRKARKIQFRDTDVFDKDCYSALVSLAVPKDSGIYLAPLPRQETLYSNLLSLRMFPKRIYIAQTDYRSPADVWERLREYNKEAKSGWLLKEGNIYCFHDLSERSWRDVCDQGTVESYNGDYWAYADDPIVVP